MKYLSKIRSLRNDAWRILYILSGILLFISFLYGVYQHNIRSVFCLALSFICTLVAFICVFLIKDSRRDIRLLELFPVYLFFSLFWDLSYFSPYTEKTYILNTYIGILALNIPLIVLSFYFMFYKKYYKELLNKLKEYKILILLLLLFVCLSYETFTSWTRLDTNIYFTYLEDAKNWNLSFDMIDLFRLGGHQSIGYTLWGLVGIYLTPGSPVGVRIINIILVSISTVCFYLILKKFFNSELLRLLLTSLLLFNPLILGIIYEVNLDLPSTCFYIWVLCTLLYKKKFYMLFSAFFLVFSKETGILLLFGIALGWALEQIYEIYLIKDRKNILKCLDWNIIFIFGMPAFVLLLFKRMGLLWRQSKNSLEFSSQKMDTWGFNIDNSIIKLKELFLLNFAWIFILVILVCLLVLITRRKKVFNKTSDLLKSLPLLISFVLFIGFQFAYVTYSHIRYITPYLVGLIFIFGILVNKTFSEKSNIIIYSVVLILLGIQNYYTLDPVSRLSCEIINIGKSEIYSTRTFVRSSDNETITKHTDPELVTYLEMTQSAIYNRQYLYFENVFEKFLRHIQYDDETLILVAPIYDKRVDDMTWISLFGKWYSKELYYIPERYQVVDNSEYPVLNLLVVNEEDETSYDLYDRVYLLSFPYNKLFDTEKFVDNYDIINRFQVEERFWYIDVFQLK